MAHPLATPATTLYIHQQLNYAGHNFSGVGTEPAMRSDQKSTVTVTRPDGLVVEVQDVPDAEQAAVTSRVSSMDLSKIAQDVKYTKQIFDLRGITASKRVFWIGVNRATGFWMDLAGGSGWLPDMNPGKNQGLGDVMLSLEVNGDLSVKLSKGSTPHDLYLEMTIVQM